MKGADVSLDGETNVSPDYQETSNAFTGKIVKVTVVQQQGGNACTCTAPRVIANGV
jgi:hypothetical protein